MDKDEDKETFGQFKPVLNNWYMENGQYTGTAKLTFPSGRSFQGAAVVSWDDTGRAEIFVELAPSDALQSPELAYIAIEVNGLEGTLTANNAFVIDSNTHIDSTGASANVTLTASKSIYDTMLPPPAVYWVAPLVNFISDFRYKSSATDNHPLRLYPTPPVPEGIRGNDSLFATHAANSQNKLITFQFSGNPAFIEQLPNYSETKLALQSGIKVKAATALMIGSVPNTAQQQANLDWFPYAYLHALSVASGTSVGIPFIELRSSEGELIRRIHASSNVRTYRKGPSTIHELFCKADSGSPTGSLMEAMHASVATKHHLRTVASYLVAASTHSGPIEDYADDLVRALETLATAEGVAQQDLLDGVPDSSIASVKASLDAAAAAIKNESDLLRQGGNTNAADRVSRIADRARSASQKEAMFGLAVTALARKHSLADEKVLNSVLAARTPPSSWASELSRIRGAAIHKGYFQLESRSELFSHYGFIRHLHDFVVRLLLLELAYKGTYQPVVAKWEGQDKPLDWVTETTAPTELRLE